MAQTIEAAAGYMLDNGWRDARRRLSLLEELLDPATTRRMTSLGTGSGWRCAEVGAGGGSIARWLCAQVGGRGRVVAVDLDTRFVEGSPQRNLEVRRANVVTDDLERDAFDLVHTRALLMHLPSRAEVLGRLVGSLRAGGWLLLEEIDFYPLAATADGAYHRAWEAILDAWAAGGGAVDWARGTPSLLDAHGLDAVDTETTVHAFRGGSAMAEFVQLTFQQLRAPALAGGRLPEELLDTVIGQLGDTGRWFPGFAVVAAWGRRPLRS